MTQQTVVFLWRAIFILFAPLQSGKNDGKTKRFYITLFAWICFWNKFVFRAVNSWIRSRWWRGRTFSSPADENAETHFMLKVYYTTRRCNVNKGAEYLIRKYFCLFPVCKYCWNENVCDWTRRIWVAPGENINKPANIDILLIAIKFFARHGALSAATKRLSINWCHCDANRFDAQWEQIRLFTSIPQTIFFFLLCLTSDFLAIWAATQEQTWLMSSHILHYSLEHLTHLLHYLTNQTIVNN